MISVGRIIRTVCERAGITELDIDPALDEIEVVGYVVNREADGLGILEPLRMIGAFDIVDRGTQLRFVRRGAAPVDTIDLNELGAVGQGEEPEPSITTIKTQDYELPLQVRVQYSSLARDYEKGEQLSPTRIGTIGVSEITVQCPLILSDDQGAQLAEVLWREAWAARWQHSFTLDQERWAVEEGDALLLPVDGRLHRVRVVSFDNIGLLRRKANAVRDDNGAYVSTAVATPPLRPPTVLQLLGEAAANLLDIPALREVDSDPGFYSTAYRTGVGLKWTGARLHRSVDGGATYRAIAGLGNEAITGVVRRAPLAGDGYTWSDDYFEIELEGSGELESRNDDAVLAGANAAAIGAHGRWQIVQFANAELIAPRRYRLSRLLLGRRGTEYLIPATAAGDTFVLVSGPGVYRTVMETVEIGAERIYRAVMGGAPFDSAEDFRFTGRGQALKPFAPVGVTQTKEDDGNLTIAWQRRDRLGQTMRDGVELALSEDEEAYVVEILSASLQVLRTLEVEEPEATYTLAHQVSDLGSGQDSVNLRIYQLSSVVGRGIPYESFALNAPIAGVSEYGERLSRIWVEGSFVYGHRTTNAFGGGATGVLQLNLADLTINDSTAFADVLFFLHPMGGEVWALGIATDIGGSTGKLWRIAYDSDGFGTEVPTAVDVGSPICAAALGGDLYLLRQQVTPLDYHLVKVELGTVPTISETIDSDGNEIALAVNESYVFALRDDGDVVRYDRDLAEVDSVSGYSDATSMIWDDATDQLYLLTPTRLVALDEDLAEQWDSPLTSEATGGFPTNNVPSLQGINLAIDATSGEAWVSMLPASWPAGTNQQEAMFIGRIDASDGTWLGYFPLRGASQVVAASFGAMYVNTVTLESGGIVEVPRFKRLSSSYLSEIAVSEP